MSVNKWTYTPPLPQASAHQCLHSHSQFFWSVFSRIWAEYGDLLCIFPLFGKNVKTLYSPYSVVMQDNGPEKLQRWILFKKRSGYFQKEMYNISSSSTLFSRKILLQEVLKSVTTTAFLCDKKHALLSILFSNSDSETLL